MTKNILPYLSLLILLVASTPTAAWADLTPLFNNINLPTPYKLAELKFPDNGAPRGRRKGGTSRRDGCPKLELPITALVWGEDNDSLLASTVSEYPTFWVYLPLLPKTLVLGEFVLQDNQGNDIWRKTITLPTQAGTIAINLPPNPQYALKTDSKYHWYFKVYCGKEQNKSQYIYVDAWIQKIALPPNVKQQLETSKSQRFQIYATHKLWYEAITDLADLRRSSSLNNNDVNTLLTKDWNNLLKSLDLGELASAPIIQFKNISLKSVIHPYSP
jgi:Domain of Unknown Function (DUF928)